MSFWKTPKWRLLEELKAEMEKRNIPWRNIWQLNEHNAKILMKLLKGTNTKLCPHCNGKGVIEE